MKKEEKMIAPDTNEGIVEPKEIFIVVENKRCAKSTLLDYIKFGAGFYIGFKLARGIKYAIVNSVSKK